MPGPKGKILFLYFEFVGLSFFLAVYAAFLRYILGDLLGLKDLLNILLYWTLYGVGAATLAFGARKFKGNWTLKDLGFRLHRSWKEDLRFGIVIGSLMYVVTAPLEIILLPSVARLAADSMDSYLKMSLLILIPAAGILSLVFGFITGAFHEEIWYRGYLQGLFSREAAPAAGFLFSLFVFSLGHYFSHPEWGVLNVLNTVPHAFFYCLAYHATRSLVVPMAVHTLSNFIIPTFAVPLYAKGYHAASYVSLAALWFVLLSVCLLGKREVKELFHKTRKLFEKSGWRMSLLGVFLAILTLAIRWSQSCLRQHLSKPVFLLILAGCAVSTLGLSLGYKERNL